MRAFIALAFLLSLPLMASCASQARPDSAGIVGENTTQESVYQAEMEARDFYSEYAPKTYAYIRSEPAGALVEWYNSDGLWVTVGTTPSDGIAIEATGKPELFRISAPGYLPMTRWIAATEGSDKVEVSVPLEPDLPYRAIPIGR